MVKTYCPILQFGFPTETTVTQSAYIERGYESIETDLTALGANISKVIIIVVKSLDVVIARKDFSPDEAIHKLQCLDCFVNAKAFPRNDGRLCSSRDFTTMMKVILTRVQLVFSQRRR